MITPMWAVFKKDVQEPMFLHYSRDAADLSAAYFSGEVRRVIVEVKEMKPSDRVRDAIADLASVPFAAVQFDMLLIEDLGLDDTDPMDLILRLEKEFEIEYPDEAAAGCVTVRDIVMLTQTLLAKKEEG